MLPLGVVIPTKNSMPYLPAHLEGLRPWLDLAEEVVVVDSFSKDGTVDFLRANLKHPRVAYLSHPPGLYASWNHGIANVAAKYAYIATTGDVITRAGITLLVETAAALESDIIISKPNFIDQKGRSVEISWPIDDVIATLDIRAPRRLHKLEAVVFAVAHATGALTGSCASNVFRTAALKKFPFPLDFGTVGDRAWGLQHAAEVVWAVVPDRVSTFLIHPTNASAEEKKSFAEARRADEIVLSAMERWKSNGALTAQELRDSNWSQLLRTLSLYLDSKAAFDDNRLGVVPWVCNPVAWRNRMRRQRTAKRLHQLKRRILRQLS